MSNSKTGPDMIGVDASGVERPMRICTPEHNGLEIGCGKIDDHPRHVVDGGPDGTDVQFHLDCHAAAGCRSCRDQIADRPKGAVGQKMLDHILLTNAPADVQDAVETLGS